jgi:peroxiredoxin
MSKRKVLTGFAAAMLVLSGCAKNRSGESMGSGAGSATADLVALRAEETRPLGVGDRAPNATLSTPDGTNTQFRKVAAASPTILIFYRGGWCPYCNRHLAEVGSVEEEILQMGYQIVAVSPDSPASLRESLSKQELGYRLYSDSDMSLARGFGLAFHVDDATVEKYKWYGIDLDKATGRSHHDLPVPAVFIVDKGGVIRFAHTNPDYKVRLSAEEILAAAKSAR